MVRLETGKLPLLDNSYKATVNSDLENSICVDLYLTQFTFIYANSKKPLKVVPIKIIKIKQNFQKMFVTLGA